MKPVCPGVFAEGVGAGFVVVSRARTRGLHDARADAPTFRGLESGPAIRWYTRIRRRAGDSVRIPRDSVTGSRRIRPVIPA